MLPVIALVGRPNVGKSTLFNRVTRTQNALVANFPGLTRDRQYGEAQHNDKHFLVVDTGGVGVEDQAVDSLMSDQSATAIKEADLIWLVVDARDGLIGLDSAIMTNLRKQSKPIKLIINKIDGLNESEVGLEFSALGIPESSTYHISSSHGRGIQNLLDETVATFPADESANDEQGELDNNIRVAFIGRPNVGKSTLINRILGEERVVVYDMPGTTRDSISVPFERDDTSYTLIDTAGIRRRGKINEAVEKFSVVKTLQAIKQANVCLLLFDAQEGLTDQDLHLLGEIIEAGRALVIVANKWDGLDEEHKDHIKNELERRLRFVKYAPIRFISALHGSGVGTLYADINAAYQAAHQKFSTPKLTRILLEAVASHPPPSIQGRRIKLRFAHAGGHNPPIIVIHGNQVSALSDSYKRYLMNTFINTLNLVGTPLKLEFKSGTNPFQGKKNKLSERQVKRKKRLMKFVKKKK